MVTPYDGYVDVCAALAELTPGDHAKKSALFNSGAEAVENAVKIARVATGRDAVGGLRPRLPRAHQPHDGDDRQEHALQARVRPVRRRGLPGADVLPVPRRAVRRGGRGPGDRRARQAGRRRQPRLRGDRADPGRGRLRRPGARLPAGARRVVRRPTASCSSPTRSRPASAAPATGSPATHEGVVPDLVTTAKGIAGGLPLAGGHRPRRADGLASTSAASAAPTAATRSPAPPRSARSRRCAATTSPAGPAQIGAIMHARLTALPREHPVDRRRPRPRRDDGDRALRARHHRRPTRSARPRSRRTATSRASSRSPAAPGATSSASCRRSRSPTPCSHEAFDVVAEAFAATA